MKLKHIKKSFEERKIAVKDTSWDSLAARLDAAEAKQSKPALYYLMAIAAIIVLALFIYPLLNKDIIPQQDQNEMVIDEGDSSNNAADLKSENDMLKSDRISLTKESDLIIESQPVSPKKETFQKKSGTTNSKDAIVASKTVKAIVVDNIETSVKQAPNLSGKKEHLLSNRSKETTSSLFTIAANQDNMLQNSLDQEMDVLLNEALKKQTLLKTSIEPQDSYVLQLVRETEWDIQSDRRNKVDIFIFDQLGKLKTEAYALVDRND